MKKIHLSVLVSLIAACLFYPASSHAQKGKGGGKSASSPGNAKPFSADKGEPARTFEHPKSGNDLPQSTRDQLPPGLRDKPENQPGLANHFRKLDTKQNSLPQEVRDKLPPGLRDQPDNNPGLANHLRQMGVLKDYPQIDPVPTQIRNQMPAWMRNQPYDNPGVANYLGKLGYSYGQDGALIPPASPSPLAPGLNLPQSFQPFGGLFRRR